MSREADSDPTNGKAAGEPSDEGSVPPVPLQKFRYRGWRWSTLLQVVRDAPNEMPLELVFVGEELDGEGVARYGLPLDDEIIDKLSDSLGTLGSGRLEDLLHRAWEEGRKLEENGSGTSL